MVQKHDQRSPGMAEAKCWHFACLLLLPPHLTCFSYFSEDSHTWRMELLARPACLNFSPWTGRFLKPHLDPVSHDSTPSLEGRENLGLTVEVIMEHRGPTVTSTTLSVSGRFREPAPYIGISCISIRVVPLSPCVLVCVSVCVLGEETGILGRENSSITSGVSIPTHKGPWGHCST